MLLYPENKAKNIIVIGTDEAGRGPLAGPVTAGAVYLPVDFPKQYLSLIQDSKKLSEVKRNSIATLLYQYAKVAVVHISPQQIDEMNIRVASLEAMSQAVKILCKEAHLHLGDDDVILVDGRDRLETIKQSHAVVKGDSLYIPIAAASIVAKTARDDMMYKLDEIYPQYGFARHKGYPTKAHRDALAQYGACPEHRRSFAPVRHFLKE